MTTNDVLYRHRQFGTVIYGLVGSAILLVMLMFGLESQIALAKPVVLLLGLVLLAFGALTVTVTTEEVELRFGIGWIRRRIALSSVEAVEPVRNRWFYGWGIRLTPHGWMWNVSGLHAVELQFRDGRRFRIGTDDPEGLTEVLRGSLEAGQLGLATSR